MREKENSATCNYNPDVSVRFGETSYREYERNPDETEPMVIYNENYDEPDHVEADLSRDSYIPIKSGNLRAMNNNPNERTRGIPRVLQNGYGNDPSTLKCQNARDSIKREFQKLNESSVSS